MSRLPATWAECSIGDAVAPIQLVDPRKSPEVVFTYVDIGAIDNKSQEIVDPKRIAGAKAPSRARRQIKAGDTLFSTVRTYLRNIALVPLSLNDCVTSTGICVLRPLPGINPTYLFNWVRSNAFIDAMSHAMDGTMYPAVRDSDVLGGNLPLAPTAEQDRIVAKTIALFAKTRRAREELSHVPRLVEHYREAILAAAFRGDLTADWRQKRHLSVSLAELEGIRRSAWHLARQGNVCGGQYKPPEGPAWHPDFELPHGWLWASVDQVSFAVQYGSSAKTSEEPDGVAVLRMGNIQDGEIDLSSLKFLPHDHAEFPALLLEPGDVLFNRTNSAELVGKSAVYKGHPKRASFASYLIRIKSCGLLPSLLSAYINSVFGREWIATVVSQQVGQANVNGSKLKQLGVPVMSVEEQDEIARRVEIALSWVNRITRDHRAASQLLDGLDQAILAKAFKGELTPQDPNDEPASVLLERIRKEQSAQPRRKGRRAVGSTETVRT